MKAHEPQSISIAAQRVCQSVDGTHPLEAGVARRNRHPPVNARQILARASTNVIRHQPLVLVETHAIVGRTSEALQDVMREIRPDLLVIGSDAISPMKVVRRSKVVKNQIRTYAGPLILVMEADGAIAKVVTVETENREAELPRELLELLKVNEHTKFIRAQSSDDAAGTVEVNLWQGACAVARQPNATTSGKPAGDRR